MGYKCVGCDRDIGWDGKGMFSYTCVCGGRILYQVETLSMAFPATMLRSLALAAGLRATGLPTPHLNDLVGESDFTSPLKERLIVELQNKGFIWMEECDQCKKDGTLAKRQEREKYLALREAETIVRREKGD